MSLYSLQWHCIQPLPTMSHPLHSCAFCMPQVLFAFEFESEWPNGNSATKQSLNYHLSDLEKSVEQSKMVIHQLFCLWIAIWPFNWLYPNLTNGDLATVLLLNCHSAVQTQTQAETEVFRKQAFLILRTFWKISLFLSSVVIALSIGHFFVWLYFTSLH